MKKRAFAALAMAVLFTVSGCKLIEKDLSVDAKTVIAEVAGQPITKGEAQGVFNATLSQYVSLYQAYGISISADDEALQSDAKQAALDTLTAQRVSDIQFETRGLSLAEDELKKIQTDSEESYESALASNIETLKLSNTSLTDEAARAQIIAALDAQGLTKEYILEMTRAAAIEDKLYEDAVKNVTVSDDEIQAEYDTRVLGQKDSYAAAPTQFGTDLTNGELIVYRPGGYRYVKNLLIGMPEDIQTQIDEANDSLYTNSYNRISLEQQIAEYGDADEATQQLFNGLLADIDASDAEQNAKIADLRRQGKEQILSKAENVLSLAKAPGADFDTLISSYGTDSGMTVEPAQTNGYLISEETTTYVAPFHDASMALGAPGDISDLVETDYGYHIILFSSEIPEGEVPLAEVKDALASELLDA
ncbi:MAG: peptidylprolyl isomerase, partial [Oscillospiraceae bacterium]|nr:peptidylprolyl isomerase [Oscillospiraceae bacterium]